MSSVIDDTDVIQHISVEEGKAILDQEARAYLGISGEEFIRRYVGGDLEELVERDPSSVSRVSMSLPLAGVRLDAWKQGRRGA